LPCSCAAPNWAEPRWRLPDVMGRPCIATSDVSFRSSQTPR
jgi:hypothetical protein